MIVKRMSDAPCSLTVHYLDAVGPSPEGAVDLVNDPRDRFLDGHAVQVYVGGGHCFNNRRRRALIRMPSARPFLSSAFRRTREVLLEAPHRDPFNADAIPSAAAGFQHHSSFVPEAQDDDVGADDHTELLRRGRFVLRHTIFPVTPPSVHDQNWYYQTPPWLAAGVYGRVRRTPTSGIRIARRIPPVD